MRVSVLVLALAAALTLGGCGEPTEPPPAAPASEFVSGELLAELVPGLADSTAARRLAELGLALVRRISDEPPLVNIRVPEGGELYWAEELVRQELVVWAEPNGIVRLP